MPSTHSLYNNGANVTGHATNEVAAARFVKVAGTRTAGNITAIHATAGSRVLGVAGYPAKAGDLVHVLRGSRIVGVESTGAIAAGANVAAAADGKAAAASEGDAIVGQAIDAAANGIVYVALA